MAAGAGRGRRLAARWGLAVVGVVALLLGARALLLPGNDPAAGGEADRSVIAVLPFSVRGDEEFGDLSEGMVSLLGTKLDGAGDLRAIDSRALLSHIERESLPVSSPEDGRAVSLRFGAGYYIMGDVLRVGDRLQVTASLYGVDRSTPVADASTEGSLADLFAQVDELAAQLLAGLAGGPAARVRRIAAVTTASLPALKAFLEGERLARRAQFGAAVDALGRAVALDSTFALAHYRLALAAEWNLQDDLARSAAEQAVRWGSRLADRDRRLLEAFLLRRRGGNAEAERLYRSILGTYPDEMEAWVDLNEILFHAAPLRGKSFTESREALERVLGFDATHSTTLIHLARLAAFEGNVEEVDSLAARFLSLNPEADRTFEIRALQAFAHGDSARQRGIMAELREADDLSVALAAWDVAVFARDIEAGAEISRLLAAPDRSVEARTLGHAWRAHLLLGRGRLAEARAEIDALRTTNPGHAAEYRALFAALPFLPVDTAEVRGALAELRSVDPQAIARSDNPSVVFTAHDRLHAPIRLYLMGLLHVRLGELGEAAAFADTVSRTAVPLTAGSLPDDLSRSIRAQIARAEGRPADALDLLEGSRMETWYGQTLASPFYSQVLERFVRAETLREVGRSGDALAWYRHIAELSPFEAPYRAVADLRAADIHAAEGREAESREAMARAGRLWDRADPELAALLQR